tara:strand:- start:12 stop:299 length:288 start_codon:yes stop_codon:yes gene_type:complete
MTSNKPIYSIAKELRIDSKRIILACKKLGINAKGSTKRLNKEELEKVKNYFATGKNVSEEIVEIGKINPRTKVKKINIKRETKNFYFPNRLIDKS